MTDERIIVYEKPTCTTCRQLAKILREAGIEYEAVNYLLDPIPRDELARRLAERRGHFMPAALLDSQLAALEPPAADERAVTIDASKSPDEVVGVVLTTLRPDG